jgi:hypothetical protein
LSNGYSCEPLGIIGKERRKKLVCGVFYGAVSSWTLGLQRQIVGWLVNADFEIVANETVVA